MGTMTPRIKTACHKCRIMENIRVRDGEGWRVRQVPAAGDGELVRFTMAANGVTLATVDTCDLCGGSGWLPGFVTPG